MPSVDVVRITKATESIRARQVAGMFDCPYDEERVQSWKGDIPIDEEPWNIGLIVGPSGSGKTTLAREMFPEDYGPTFKWDAPNIIDDFSSELSIVDISNALMSVGFNTIPAWLRPFSVLSTGEQFRVSIARTCLETSSDRPVVIDEFTSVVDRQVAKVACHATQKFIRKESRQLVAVACHYDIIDWLQPDWILEPATMNFQRRHLRQRPSIDVEIRRVKYSAWKLFAPYHYLTAKLNKAARCYCLFIQDRPVSFLGILHQAGHKNLTRISRHVTLPDYQGCGLAFVLGDTIASMNKALQLRTRNYPAHPAFVRSNARSTMWRQTKKAGTFQAKPVYYDSSKSTPRTSAVFEYTGPPWPDKDEAQNLIFG